MDEQEDMNQDFSDSDANHDTTEDEEYSGTEDEDYNGTENVELNNGAECTSQTSISRKRKIIEDETKPRKKLDKGFYKAPTVEELNQLRETENLFHSNLFRLQIEEVLNEVKIKDKYKRLFNVWFDRLKCAIFSIEDTEEYQLTDITDIADKLNCKLPIPEVPNETKGIFKFQQPSNIGIVGSYAFDCTVGPNVIIDVAVEMPEELFQKQDYQNFRYFKKKAIYLAYVNSVIGNDLAESKRFIGNNIKPLLKIVPKGKLSKKVIVHVHIAAQETSFKLNRFLPEKNSVRQAWFFNDENVEYDHLLPTPHYNTIVLQDLIMFRMNSEMMKIRDYPNIRDGIILLKIWLEQRELIKGFDAFGSHLITMYILYLLQTKKLNTFMSSYQIVRNVWNCLVQNDWHKSGIAMCQNDDVEKRIEEYHKYYDCVFLDSSGYHNLAAHITTETFYWVRREAEICLKHLDNIYINSFQSLFMRRVPFIRTFDQLICFHDTKELENVTGVKKTLEDRLDYSMNKRKQIIKVIVNILKEGLGEGIRIHCICVLPSKYKEWECTEEAPTDIDKIIIGLELNPDNCFKVIQKGPEANLPEAAAFRQFWENRSELRRFRDGSIQEAVVWGKGVTLAEKRSICQRIVLFLLTNKLKLSTNCFTYISSQMEKLLRRTKIKITHFNYGTGEEASLQIIRSFDSLEKQLRSLTDMPLSISGIQGLSEVFRYTDVFPPLSTNHQPVKKITRPSGDYLVLNEETIRISPNYVQPLDVILQLSMSGKWPEDLTALRKTKTAFYIQIAECLRKQHRLKAEGSATHVNVLKDGFIFRLKIALQKEIALLKRQVDQDGVIKYRDTEESITLENESFHMPKLSSALHGLYLQQPSFGAACCLAKRWFSAQLLDDYHMPHIVIELLMASMYLIPEPYKPAQMPQIAFIRFLEMLTRAHWSTDPIIVNFNDEMTKEEVMEIETHFGTSRSSLPPLFISTPYDQKRSLWTQKAPTLPILNRISALAKASLKLFEDQYLTTTLLEYKPMFRPPLSEFDCLIHLKVPFNPRRLEAIDVPDHEETILLQPYKRNSSQKIPVIDFDPVQCYLKELRNNYDDFVLVFHDTYGGTVIGVVLKPDALQPKEFKVSTVHCRFVKDDQLVLNVPAMVQDFHILGRGIVRNIEIQSQTMKSLLS